jgi:hypothetical protein
VNEKNQYSEREKKRRTKSHFTYNLERTFSSIQLDDDNVVVSSFAVMCEEKQVWSFVMMCLIFFRLEHAPFCPKEKEEMKINCL